MTTADVKPFSTAVGLTRRTMPFLLLNALVYGAFFLAVVLWLGVFGGLAVFFADRVELLAIVFFVIAIAAPAAVLGFARRYVLYLVQGAHIAVVTELLTRGQVPEGKGQVEYGRGLVKELFRDVSILFALDRLIDGVVKRITRRFVRLVDVLPLGGGASQVARWAAAIVNRSMSYVDEAILSLTLVRGERNVWRSARHGLILYAQAYKPVLGAAVRIWLLGRAIFLVVLLLVAIPGAFLLANAEGLLVVVLVVGLVLLSSLLVRAVFEPFAMVYILVTYHQAIEGVEVNAEWDRRLQSVSDKFRELVGQAQQASPDVDPLDQVDVPPAAIGDGTPGAPSAPGAANTPGFGGLGGRSGLRPGRGGVGGMVGGLLSQAAQSMQQPQGSGDPSQASGSQPAPPPPAPPAPPPASSSDPPPPPPGGSRS